MFGRSLLKTWSSAPKYHGVVVPCVPSTSKYSALAVCSTLGGGGPLILRNNEGKCSAFPQLQQIRGRKRVMKLPTRAEKMARREAKLAKEAERRKYSFMQRIENKKMRSLQSPSQQWPGRFDPEKDAELPSEPPCDIYLTDTVRTKFYSISEALQMHRETQQPSMFNNPKAPVRLRLELNMTTEKSTRMVTNAKAVVPVPFPFQHGQKRTILAFVDDEQIREKAVEAGAELAIGKDMIKKIVKGQFNTSDYDFCVCYVDMATHISPLRGILRQRFPTAGNGGLGDDVGELVQKFRTGVQVVVTGDPIYPHWGLCDTIVGRLNMSDAELEANIESVLHVVCGYRNPALGAFVNRGVLMVEPGIEFFPVDLSKYYPKPTEKDIERVEKSKKRKKKDDKKEAVPAAGSGTADADDQTVAAQVAVEADEQREARAEAV